MKKLSITVAFAFITALAFGQIENPVSWSYEAKKKTEKYVRDYFNRRF